MRKGWLAYVIAYLSLEIWLRVHFLASIEVNITALLYWGMLVAVIGLALNRRFLTQKFWRIVSGFGALLFVHSWFIMPVLYASEGMRWGQIAFIQMIGAVPSLPVFVGLYIYAWRSPGIWDSIGQQGAQAGPKSV